MDLEKNSKLYPEVCNITIKSVLGKVSLADFTALYATPSSIKWNKSTSNTGPGILYNHIVNLIYPGLKETDFLNFHELLKDKFEIKAQFLNGDVFQLNNSLYPFKLSYKFIQGKGLHITFKGSTPLITTFSHNTIINGLPYRLTFSL